MGGWQDNLPFMAIPRTTPLSVAPIPYIANTYSLLHCLETNGLVAQVGILPSSSLVEDISVFST